MTIRPALLLAFLVAAPTLARMNPAAAQGASSTRLNPSVRAAGMGGASSAVAWSNDVNGWANPALLGYASGFQYRWSNTRLLPGFVPDWWFQTDRASYGWGGIGLAVESHTLSYGEQTDSQGRLVEPTEHVRPLSGGISLARALEAAASPRGGAAPRFTQYADVGVGLSRKRIRLRNWPGGDAETDANDFGVLVRVTPLPKPEAGRPSVDLTYGFAALNYNDASLPGTGLFSSYVPHQYRHGVAGRVDIPLPQGAAASLERRLGRWIAAGMDPLLSLIVAADFARY